MKRLQLLMFFGAVSLVFGCGDDGDGPGGGHEPSVWDEHGCDPQREPCEFEHSFVRTVLEPGQERNRVCVSWTFDNPTDMWINSVTVENDGGFHHSNWYFVPKELYNVPDGEWNCNDEGWDDLTAAVAGGVLFAQSTQSTDESQTFPEGTAIRMPANMRIIANTHLFNVSPEVLDTGATLKINTLPPSDVATRLTGFRMAYYDLNIAANKRTEVTVTCPNLKSAYEAQMGRPFEMSVFYVLPHYHELGVFSRLSIVGGSEDGKDIYSIEAPPGEPWGRGIEPAVDIAALGATGLSMSCGFENPRGDEVGWGINDQEMCVLMGFSDSGYAFEGAVHVPNQDRDDLSLWVREEDDEIRRDTGPCTLIGLPYMEGDSPGDEPAPSCVAIVDCCPTLDENARRTCEAAVQGNVEATCQSVLDERCA